MKSSWIILFMLFFGSGVVAQELPDIERLLEENEISSAQEDHEEIVAALLRLATRPLPLNQASFDDLKPLIFLSDSQIDNILKFRERLGAFRHASELLLVPGISRGDLENILPFIEIDPSPPREEPPFASRRVSHELLARARTSRPRQEGYKRYSPDAFLSESAYQKHLTDRFQGPAWGTLLKYRVNAGNSWQAGLVLENDAGEPYFSRDQETGFDFLSAHATLTTSRFVERLIVGDYKLQFGQGLVAWHGFAAGKSPATLGNEKAGRGIVPHASTDENKFLRGVAVTLRPSRALTTTLFFSSKRTDARVLDRDALDPEDAEEATIEQGGYHRNVTEMQKKHTLKELTTGLSIDYNHPAFRVGTRLLYYDFSPRLRVGTAAYQRYNDTGARRALAGVDYKTAFRDFYLFGETAVSDNRSLSTVNGVRYSGFSWLSLSAIYRRYDKRYASYYNNGFGEYANTSNEEGVYAGLEVVPLRDLKINFYHDWFRHFSPRYRATAPGRGREWLVEALYRRERNEWLFRSKRETKPEDSRVDGILQTIPRSRQEYRLQYTCKEFAPLLELRSRVDHSRYLKDSARETGFLVYQDVVLTLAKPGLKTQIRLAYFDTDTYNARVYAYEHNVLHGYSFPSYYYRGYRSYINLNWKPTRSVTLYVKGGVIYYPDRASISSSLARVDDNKLFDFTVQVRVKL
ncbi:MAG: helix-hairpin-helix domain-containing protein [Odoribacteraceae bacterium]|jgi:hypothetical protein|nr:helix-hairpin-helix domain-containing protein [Odoribacteraceae bacterium]